MELNRTTIIKLVELILAVICACIHYITFEANSKFFHYVFSLTFGGFVIILIGVFIGLATDNPVHKNVDLFFCIAGAILYIVSGVFLVILYTDDMSSYRKHATLGLIKGILAIVQGVVFIVDAYFTFKAE